jgi:UDP-N-acetylmuramoylalanine--D-glutamate ligase
MTSKARKAKTKVEKTILPWRKKAQASGESARDDLKGKRILIVGLKRSGVAAARFCAEQGARTTVSDAAGREALEPEIQALRDYAIDFELGGHKEKTFLKADLIVVSPGVPLVIEPIQAALKKGIAVASELDFASRFLKGRVVAFTGSNGKTTSTTLAGDVFCTAGFHTQVGGNIGTPVSSLVHTSTDETITVVEVSSFQLEAIPTFRPNIGVVLNVTPDHLDRYASFEEYASFKHALFKNQTANDWAVLNADDPVTTSFARDLPGRVWWFSQRRALEEGCFYVNQEVCVAHEGVSMPVIRRDQIPLLGAHNIENCLAVVSTSAILGIDFLSVSRAIQEFPGVEHRLEFVTEIGGVKFYNDSKATNVDATSKALEAFAGNIILILGGKDKGSDYSILAPLLRERVKRIFLIGAAAEKIERQLTGVIPLQRCDTLRGAVGAVPTIAQSGDVVLLAPACASFDQFENYEHRGRVFKELVRGLKKEVRETQSP